MRHWHLGLLLVSAGCNKAGYEAVAIRPISGWLDGCATVEITGHGFGDEISASIGSNEVTDITRPDDEEERTFSFFATVPAGDAVGATDVLVTSDGKESTIAGGYYYLECPAPGTIDGLAPEEGVAAGDTVSIAGCGLDASTMEVVIYDPAGVVADVTATLTSDCGTAFVSFTAPALADGEYEILVRDSTTHAVLNPVTGDPRECPIDTSAPCDAAHTITYGGA